MRVSTHSLGVKCNDCREVLVDDLCKCGMRHGHTFQPANPWAAETWPEHKCFKNGDGV